MFKKDPSDLEDTDADLDATLSQIIQFKDRLRRYVSKNICYFNESNVVPKELVVNRYDFYQPTLDNCRVDFRNFRATASTNIKIAGVSVIDRDIDTLTNNLATQLFYSLEPKEKTSA